MATITGLTAARMLEIEGASIVDAEIVSDDLVLEKHDGTFINAGAVTGPEGPQGPIGPSGLSSIPGEIKLWSGSTLPALGTYGKWVWADGAVYVIATYPIAAGHIADAWNTFGGASDPGGANFRVPDLRGLAPVGMDGMPGGSRANRLTRAAAIILAAKTGEETHALTIAETKSHNHGGVATFAGDHTHQVAGQMEFGSPPVTHGGDNPLNILLPNGSGWSAYNINTGSADGGAHQHPIPSEGGNGAHENVQPSVMVPYIVRLD